MPKVANLATTIIGYVDKEELIHCPECTRTEERGRSSFSRYIMADEAVPPRVKCAGCSRELTLGKKWPRLKGDWPGAIVLIIVELTNGYVAIPPGTMAVVDYSRGGLHLVCAPCKHCGMRARIRKVPVSDTLLLWLPPGVS